MKYFRIEVVVVDSIFAQFSDLERDMQVLCYFLYIFA